MPPVHLAGSEGDVRVVRVTRRGSNAGWSALVNAISKLTSMGFVAIDTEFSGFGSDSKLSDPDLTVRYEAIRALVDSGAILSLGIAVFNLRDGGNDEGVAAGVGQVVLASDSGGEKGAEDEKEATSTYDASVFDFCLSCDTPWTVCSNSGQFLVSHGFDFNRLFSAGIPYKRASTAHAGQKSEAEGSEKSVGHKAGGKKCCVAGTGGMQLGVFSWEPMPRGLLWRIGRAGVPLVVHNGLLDIAFLYAAFHGPLPDTLNGFVGVVLDAVPGGIYDTKHLACGIGNVRATFLAYVYAQAVQSRQVRARTGSGLPRSEVASPEDGSRAVTGRRGSTATPTAPVASGFCILYAMRGHCPKGTSCVLGHDVFAVVAHEASGKTVPSDIKEGRRLYKAQNDEKKRIRGRDSNGVAGGRDGDGGDGSEMKKAKLSKKQKKRALETERAEAGTDELEVRQVVARGADVEVKEHCAGYDAYMTGICFGWLRGKRGASGERNMVSLAKKGRPLVFCRSDFGEVNRSVFDDDKTNVETNEEQVGS
jgi:target of EGR1 protein 1